MQRRKSEGVDPEEKSWKDLLGFYTAECISPKVDLKKKKRRGNIEMKDTNKQTNTHMTNEQTKNI